MNKVECVLLLIALNAAPVSNASKAFALPVPYARPILTTQNITRQELNRLIHLGTPQSYATMRRFLGIPAYAYANVEYFPMANDERVWVALIYDDQNRYRGYYFEME